MHYDEENDCETFRCSDNVKEINQCLERQFDILRSLDQKLVDELESQAKVREELNLKKNAFFRALPE